MRTLRGYRINACMFDLSVSMCNVSHDSRSSVCSIGGCDCSCMCGRSSGFRLQRWLMPLQHSVSAGKKQITVCPVSNRFIVHALHAERNRVCYGGARKITAPAGSNGFILQVSQASAQVALRVPLDRLHCACQCVNVVACAVVVHQSGNSAGL